MWRSFLLGALATGGQVLLLREMIGSFYGDEVFVGLAMAGWLLWVALGSWLGGRIKRSIAPEPLFILTALILPLSLVLIRLSPLVLADYVGEAVSFIDATLVSLLLVGPVAFLCGLLFPALARGGGDAAQSTLKVYLMEGAGAFFIGAVLTLTLGRLLSSLGFALSLTLLAILLVQFASLRSMNLRMIFAALLLVALFAVPFLQERFDISLDAVRYRPFHVEKSFDTPYTKQTLLAREGTIDLITDGQVEALFPDIEANENTLIPPLLYNPQASHVLLFGRPELGLADLCDAIGGLELAAVDPRNMTDCFASFSDRHDPPVPTDPVDFVRNPDRQGSYDMMVIPLAGLDSYRTSRMLSGRFLEDSRRLLAENGILAILLTIDTDRYITEDAQHLLAVIYHSVKEQFEQVIVWPGTSTIIMASQEPVFNLSFRQLMDRIRLLKYQPEYVREEYLTDRLAPLKVERTLQRITIPAPRQTIERPIIPSIARRIRSETYPSDFLFMDILSSTTVWKIICAIVAAALLLVLLMGRARPQLTARFLFMSAGALSIGLELILFYLFQSIVGSLYTYLGIMIGSFMLGLTGGVFISHRRPRRVHGAAALGIFILAPLAILFSYDWISPSQMMVAAPLVLFLAGAATGCLFATATQLYYSGASPRINRGAGYGWELLGSAAVSLTILGIFLPMLGLHTLLWSATVLAGVGMIAMLRIKTAI